MKRIMFISASLMIVSAAFAQSDATSGNSLYNFDNAADPKAVRKLGTAPEFPFLRNLTSSRQVYDAMRKHQRMNTPGIHELNGLLMQIGYTNGISDLQASNISEEYVQPGTQGNMGSRGYTYAFYRLEGSRSEFKAWKIAAASNDNGYGALYIFAKCGNAFFPQSKITACINVPVTITPDKTQITLGQSGSSATSESRVYVYYARRHRRKHEAESPIASISDKYPSRPILLSRTKDMTVTPETYNVTLSAPDNSVSACPGTPLNLTANVNVEKTSTYTGNYPNSDNKTYKKVTKHQYKMIARRMRRIDRKADKIARRTGVKVDIVDTKA